jgi:GH15 family glucan-1,4-alpha-glucosidase
VLTLLKLGDLAPVGEFFSWCRSAQAKEGHWNQRYWLWAKLGPAWCLFEDFNQIDQTASVLFAFSAWWRLLDAGQKAKAWKRFRNMVSRAADFLVKATQPSGLHRQASDLWETFRGSFTYSNAAISASLKSLGQVAEEMDAPRLAERWANAAALTRQAILERLWTGSTFVRGIVDGRLDTTPDASVLGLVDPFQVLDLANEDDRKKAESLVKSLQTSLTVQLPGGPALKRFAGDTYLEGAASAVSTLALARVLLLLAAESSKLETRGSKEPQAGHAGINPQDAIQSALAYIRTVIHNTTQTGLLPEMICPPPQTPYWAAPHLWASASLIMACFYLEEARAAAGTTAP